MNARFYAVCILAVTLIALTYGYGWLEERTRMRASGVASGSPVIEPLNDTFSSRLSLQHHVVDARLNVRDGLEYVFVPAGEFAMGCGAGDTECAPDEYPVHIVRIPSSFWITRTEVTVTTYSRFVSATGGSMPPSPPFNNGWEHRDHPITNVQWKDAFTYCNWAGGRLPSEAEWEYVARGRTAGAEPASNTRGTEGLDDWSHTAPVGSFAPNAFGAHDLAGNVWEWVQDRWHADYVGAPANGSAWENPGTTAPGESAGVLRGGSWASGSRQARATHRSRWYWPGDRFDDYGFRCVIEDLADQDPPTRQK